MATICLTPEQEQETVVRILCDDLISMALLAEKDAAIDEDIRTIWNALEYYMNEKDRLRLLETWPQIESSLY